MVRSLEVFAKKLAELCDQLFASLMRPQPTYGPLPVRHQSEPIRARKLAWIVRLTDPHLPERERWGFQGASVGNIAFYRPESRSVCLLTGTHHDAPQPDCTCGFYAVKRVTGDHRTAGFFVALDVDLYGRVIRHTAGWRAEKQRVIKVTIGSICALCGTRKATCLGFSGRVLNSNAGPLQLLHALCDKCAPTFDTGERLTLADVSGYLGVEVAWGRQLLGRS